MWNSLDDNTTPQGSHGTETRESTDRSQWLKLQPMPGNVDFVWQLDQDNVQLRVKGLPGQNLTPQPLCNITKSPAGAALTRDSDNPAKRSKIVPTTVHCAILLQINRETHVHLAPLLVDWRDDSALDDLQKIIKPYVDAQGPEKKLKYAIARKICLLELQGESFAEAGTLCIERKQDWERLVTKLIAHHCGKDCEEPVPFMLELHFKYEWLTMDEDDLSFTNSVKSVLEKSKLTNIKRKLFWSNKLLKQLFTDDHVSRLIDEDRSWRSQSRRAGRDPDAEKELFKQYLLDDRTRLLATSLRSRINLSCLYKVWKNGCTLRDQNIPLKPDALGDVFECGEADDFYDKQGGFRPITFPLSHTKTSDLKHRKLKKDEVVPVFYDQTDGVNPVIGSGTFGTVYRVRVHGDYHGFSPDKDKHFALKCMNHTVQEPEAVDKEARVLEQLALLPHEHITPLYASWTQDDHSYILMPKADTNLSKFLNETERPDFSNSEDMKWLLRQYVGLTDAVRHMHDIGFDGLDITTIGAREARKQKIHSGYHFDLKPDNILIFGKIFKISDFGTSKIHKLISGQPLANTPYTTNTPDGDETWGAPDSSYGSSGPPYDIWSLGCIFLELLLWALGYSKDERERFAQARANDRTVSCHQGCESPRYTEGGARSPSRKRSRPEESTSDDEQASSVPVLTRRYWYKCDAGRYHLKPVVEAKLHDLKSECQQQGDVFDRLRSIIRRMLRINPKRRPVAGLIRGQIGNLLYQTEVNFYRHENDPQGENSLQHIRYGGYETDNTTRAPSATGSNNHQPQGITQRSRSNTLAPPSPSYGPQKLDMDRASISYAGWGFPVRDGDPDLLPSPHSGSELDPNGQRLSMRNSQYILHGRKPSLKLRDPAGYVQNISADSSDEKVSKERALRRSASSPSRSKPSYTIERTHRRRLSNNVGDSGGDADSSRTRTDVVKSISDVSSAFSGLDQSPEMIGSDLTRMKSPESMQSGDSASTAATTTVMAVSPVVDHVLDLSRNESSVKTAVEVARTDLRRDLSK